jgi:excisionase family DNA binding protein
MIDDCGSPCGDSVIVTGRALIGALYRCVLLGVAHRRANGTPSDDLRQLAKLLYRAYTSPQRHEFDQAEADQPGWTGQDPSDWCSTREAASLLGCSLRQIQRSAGDPGGLPGIRVGRVWLLHRAPVLARKAERERKAR